MWELLEVNEVAKIGDECFDPNECEWRPVSSKFGKIKIDTLPIRRKISQESEESPKTPHNTGSPKFPLGCCECSRRNGGSYGCGREYGDKPCRKYAVRSW